MEMILALLVGSAEERLEERKWARFPNSIQKNLEESQHAQNFALYRYLVNNAMRYPREWVDEGYAASVLASVSLRSQQIDLKEVKILNKTEGLTEVDIFGEVEKTLQRASLDFPNTEGELSLVLPLEWKSLRG